MNNWQQWLPFVATGIYTIAYVVVFLIQKTHIDKVKLLNETMTNYMSIFDIKDVREYVSMKEETMTMKLEKFKESYMPSEKQAREIFNKGYDLFKEYVDKQITNEVGELILFSANMLSIFSEDKREEIKNHFLPRTKEYFDKDFLDSVRKKS
jgi:hypothetical protein